MFFVYEIFHGYLKNQERIYMLFPIIEKLTYAVLSYPREFIETYEVASSLRDKLQSSFMIILNHFGAVFLCFPSGFKLQLSYFLLSKKFILN